MAEKLSTRLKVEELEARIVASHTMIIGHRGSALAPENTLAAVRRGFDDGADVVEVDVQLSSDGVPVLMHDDSVDRTTDGTGRVADLTIDQLKALDAGSWKGTAFVGEQVPTLAEALDAARGRGLLYLDLKDNWIGQSIQRVLGEAGASDQSVWVAVDQEDQVRDIRQYLSDVPILWWGPVPKRASAQYFQSMRDLGVTGFDLNWWRTPRAFFKSAQANDMFVSTYTLNSKAAFRRALKLDLDAIETDQPQKLAAFVSSIRVKLQAVQAEVSERNPLQRTAESVAQIDVDLASDTCSPPDSARSTRSDQGTAVELRPASNGENPAGRLIAVQVIDCLLDAL
jgi:glycerophosphoryl diester phosphodiesterase